MSLGTDIVNGIVSLVISVVAVVVLTDDDESWNLTDLTLAVAVSAFLSGFFTSFFTK